MAVEFSPKLSQPASAEEFTAELARVCSAAGFSHYLAMRFADDHLTKNLQVFQNAPAESREQLQAASHWSVARLLDRLRLSPLPVHFGQGLPAGLELPGYVSGVAAVARERRGGVVVCFASDAPTLDAAEMLHMTGQCVLTAHLCIPGFAALHVETCPFTQQELACLRLLLAGLSSKQTGQELEISFRTVEHHLESIRKRCGVKTTMAAAYYACSEGWIEMPTVGMFEAGG